MSRLKTIILVIFCLPATIAAIAGSSKNFNYSSEGFSCEIKPDGSMVNLKAGGVPLIKNLLLHGQYKVIDGDKHDRRFFQRTEKNFPLKVKKIDDDNYIIEKKGTLSNKKYQTAAKYSESIRLSPRSIEFNFAVTLVVPLASKSHIFRSLTYMPLDTYLSRGFRITKINGKSKLRVFPRVYTKNSGLHITGAKELLVSLDKGVFGIHAGTGTSFHLADTRSYGGKDLRIDVKEHIQWKHKAIVFPVGTEFNWSFKLFYKPHE